MIRRKKSATGGRSSRRKRAGATQRSRDVYRSPKSFQTHHRLRDVADRMPFLHRSSLRMIMKKKPYISWKPSEDSSIHFSPLDLYVFLNLDRYIVFQIHLVHEIEEMLATNNFTKEFMSGEIMYMNEGNYPTPDLNARMMPSYEVIPDEATSSSPHNSDTQASGRASSVPYEEDKEVEWVLKLTVFIMSLIIYRICLLPEDEEDDNFDEYPAYHMGTRFWSWCRRNFMGKIDSEYLESFKEIFLEKYSQENLQKYFVNEPWKYRKKIPPPPSSRRKSQNTPQGKNTKRVSIANDATSPSTSAATTSSARIANRKA